MLLRHERGFLENRANEKHDALFAAFWFDDCSDLEFLRLMKSERLTMVTSVFCFVLSSFL